MRIMINLSRLRLTNNFAATWSRQRQFQQRWVETYSWNNSDICKQPFGRDLAMRAANKLYSEKEGCFGIGNVHQLWCGHRLAWHKGNLVIGGTNDGYFEYNTSFIKQWKVDEKEEFIEWLSKQSDYSLSGWDENSEGFHETDMFYRNNQRITRERLEDFVK
jgi:hypothetical protein